MIDDAHNRHELAVLAMKRTGHHAVIHWILRHFDGPCAHLNNCEFLSLVQHVNPPPRVISRTERLDLFAGFSSAFYVDGQFQGHIRHVEENQVFSTQQDRILAMQNVEAALRLAYRVGDRLDAYLYSFEDMDLATWRGLPPGLCARGTSDRRTEVVVLRDLPNFLASRIAGGYLVTPAVVAAWRSHVQAALAAGPDDPTVYVDFPAWHRSRRYRVALSARLGLAFSDAGRQEVVPFGPVGRPGSSFEQQQAHGRASEMEITRRWLHCRDDAQWRALSADPELSALSRAFFGFDPTTEDPP